MNIRSSNQRALVAERPVADPQPLAPAGAHAGPAPPRYRELAVFLGPLVFTGLMMTTDTPIVNAVLARQAHAQESLAAFVVAFSLAMLYEAPHIMMIETGTTLATSRQALALLRRFYIGLAAVMGALGAAVVFSPLYPALVEGVMGIPPALAAAARPAVAVFLLWPLPIGWRRLHQGALIRRGHSRAVGAGATVRIVALLGTLLLLVPLLGGVISSPALGALAMLVSVSAESAYTHVSAGRLLADLPAHAPDGRPLTGRLLWRFFWPLAGTSVLSTLGRPILSAGLAAAAGAGADAALAAWGVAWGLLFLINGATLTLGQVAIAWGHPPQRGLARPWRPRDPGARCRAVGPRPGDGAKSGGGLAARHALRGTARPARQRPGDAAAAGAGAGGVHRQRPAARQTDRPSPDAPGATRRFARPRRDERRAGPWHPLAFCPAPSCRAHPRCRHHAHGLRH